MVNNCKKPKKKPGTRNNKRKKDYFVSGLKPLMSLCLSLYLPAGAGEKKPQIYIIAPSTMTPKPIKNTEGSKPMPWFTALLKAVVKL